MPISTNRSLISRIEDFSNRFWLFELFACILSWVIIAIIAAGLNRLNNKPVLYFSWGGYSHTILVLLSTILRAALMIPVVGSLGQLKWHHFRGSDTRELKALETFNNAAGGSIGSLKLLIMLKLANLACVGAILTMLTFFMPTITQQALATVNGTLTDDRSWDGILLPPVPVTNAFMYAISTNASNQLYSFQTGLWSCTSANCNYPTYQSLSVESQPNTTFNDDSSFVFLMLGEFGNAGTTLMFERVQMVAAQGAQMLTTQVRQQPISGNSPGTYVFDRVSGTRIFRFPIYFARWGYMAYPIAIVALGTLFFAITTYLTRNEHKWKNSVLAVLFHGLAHEEILRHGEVATLEEMKIASERLLVKLEDTQYGEKLMSKGSFLTEQT